jgi:hypothetical protein
MKFDPNTILVQKSTTMLSLIEELACEYSRYLIAEEERKHDIMLEVNELVSSINLIQEKT